MEPEDTQPEGMPDDVWSWVMPWHVKYRPQTLDDLIPHQDILNAIQKFISEDKLPHLLLYGPPGTGKTSTILACAKQLYKENEFNSMVLELNASDYRGMDFVRGSIFSFSSTRALFKKGFKLLILKKADAMTEDEQNSLRRVIEKFTENTRFCLICNSLSKIVPALKSRCTRFRFGPLSSEMMIPRLEHVALQENFKISPDGMKAVLTLSNGDMRKALDILKSTRGLDVTEQTVYLAARYPSRSDITLIFDWLRILNKKSAFSIIKDVLSYKSMSFRDLLTEIHLYVHQVDLPPSIRIHLLTKMADIECNERRGLEDECIRSLVSAFRGWRK